MNHKIIKNTLHSLILNFKNEASRELIHDLEKLSSREIKGSINSNQHKHMIFGMIPLNEILSFYITPHLEKISQYLLSSGQPLNVKINITELNLTSHEQDPLFSALLRGSRFLNLRDDLLDEKSQQQNSIAASDLELIRSFLLSLQSILTKKPKRICQFCYRTTSGKQACTAHLQKHGNNSHTIAKKTIQKLDQPLKKIFDRFRFQKNKFEKHLIFSTNQDNKISIETNGFILFTDDLHPLIESIENDPWESSSKALMLYLKDNAYNVFLKTQKLFSTSKNFNEFKRDAYLDKGVLDNPNATTDTAYWFIRTVLFAEFWFHAEQLLEREEQEKQAIINSVFILRKQRFSYSKIANKLGISKSYAQKIHTS